MALPAGLPDALDKLGLDHTIGYLWAMPAASCSLPASESSKEQLAGQYAAYDISFGVPLYNPSLCRLVRP